MKKLAYAVVFCLPALLGGCATPELDAIGIHIFRTFLFAVPVVSIAIAAIFLLNRWIIRSDGRTNELVCSIVGVILFPAYFSAVFGTVFGFNWIVITLCLIVGGVIGWFSYTLDELMESFWENRRMTVPGAAGIVFAGWAVLLMFSHVWMEGDMYIIKKACAKRQVIERYTYHHQTDKDGNDTSYYSWDDHHSGERVAEGDDFPELKEGVDYRLGTGALGRSDRLGRVEHYRFIGGSFFSERKGKWDPFEWLLLADPNVGFKTGSVQRVQSNFFGQPKANGGEIMSYSDLPDDYHHIMKPTADDIPPMDTVFKAAEKGYQVFRLLFTEDEYKEILYFFLGGAGLLLLVALIFPPARQPVLIFAVCASIVPFLTMLVVASRTGRMPLVSGFSGGGGGRFGGGGASGSWRDKK